MMTTYLVSAPRRLAQPLVVALRGRLSANCRERGGCDSELPLNTDRGVSILYPLAAGLGLASTLIMVIVAHEIILLRDTQKRSTASGNSRVRPFSDDAPEANMAH